MDQRPGCEHQVLVLRAPRTHGGRWFVLVPPTHRCAQRGRLLGRRTTTHKQRLRDGRLSAWRAHAWWARGWLGERPAGAPAVSSGEKLRGGGLEHERTPLEHSGFMGGPVRDPCPQVVSSGWYGCSDVTLLQLYMRVGAGGAGMEATEQKHTLQSLNTPPPSDPPTQPRSRPAAAAHAPAGSRPRRLTPARQTRRRAPVGRAPRCPAASAAPPAPPSGRAPAGRAAPACKRAHGGGGLSRRRTHVQGGILWAPSGGELLLRMYAMREGNTMGGQTRWQHDGNTMGIGGGRRELGGWGHQQRVLSSATWSCSVA